VKTVILAGGYGTRISEQSQYVPKPMIEIGGYPIMWHIMKIFSAQGHDDFVICAGYKQQVIKEYFNDYFMHDNDVVFDFSNGKNVQVSYNETPDKWKVTVANTGYDTMTGGRIGRIRQYIGDERFFLTYGDAVSNVDLDRLCEVHEKTGATVTLTGVSFAQTKSILDVSPDGIVENFREKKEEDSQLIGGGFMVCEPEIFDYVDGDACVFETDVLPRLVSEGKLSCYQHNGFWQCMDTQREYKLLESIWERGNAPWKIW